MGRRRFSACLRQMQRPSARARDPRHSPCATPPISLNICLGTLDLRLTQDLAGHQSPATTALYAAGHAQGFRDCTGVVVSRPCVACAGPKPPGTGIRYCDACRPTPGYQPRHAPYKARCANGTRPNRGMQQRPQTTRLSNVWKNATAMNKANGPLSRTSRAAVASRTANHLGKRRASAGSGAHAANASAQTGRDDVELANAHLGGFTACGAVVLGTGAAGKLQARLLREDPASRGSSRVGGLREGPEGLTLAGPGTEYQGIKWQTKTSRVAIARSGDIVITHGYTFTVSRL
jgi:hypothetical protein